MLAVGGLLLAQGPNPDRPVVFVAGDFAGAPAGALPAGWQPLTFPNVKSHTQYAAVADTVHGQVIEATAVASASGLVRKLSLDARAYPLLRWQWKTNGLIVKSDVSSKDGDDYPARIYVSFAYDPARVSWLERARYGAARLIYGEYPPHSGLNYIWEGKAPVGTVVPNPFTARVKMIVVESGAARLGQWLRYERNIIDDYRLAFGEDPPLISGVAIMTDTDNTGESAVARYGNVEFAGMPR
ncbi:MAG: DUF3047 domain-containing protein [Betaproteobacteria bacterium]